MFCKIGLPVTKAVELLIANCEIKLHVLICIKPICSKQIIGWLTDRLTDWLTH